MSVYIDKLGHILLKKGVADLDTLMSATKIKELDDTNGKRDLAQILVENFNIDHDSIYGEVAGFYGFKKVELKDENINKNRIEFIRKMFHLLPETLQEQMKLEKIIVFKYDEQKSDKLIFIAADPTNRKIPVIDVPSASRNISGADEIRKDHCLQI